MRLDGDRIRFTHPLLASLAYDRALPWDRRAAHARLARLVTDLEERARHLSLAAGDEVHAGLAAQLEEAGRRAANRGAPAAAAELLELAARHSPTQERGDRLQTAAGFHHVSGDLRRALSIYESLLEDLPPGPRRAAVLYAIGRVQLANAPERLASCERALEEVGDDDALAAHILSLIGITCWLLGETAKGLAAARDGLERAERVGDPPLVAMALATVGGLETWMLDVTPGLLQRGADIEQGLDDLLVFHDSPSFYLGIQRHFDGDLDGARSMICDVMESAERRGDEHTRGFGLVTLIEVDREAGRIAAALEHADTARAIVEQMGDPQLLLMHAFLTTAALIDAGRLAQARELAAEGLAAARAMSDWTGVAFIRGRLGRAALVGGDPDAAWAHLEGQPQTLVRQGHLHPIGHDVGRRRRNAHRPRPARRGGSAAGAVRRPRRTLEPLGPRCRRALPRPAGARRSGTTPAPSRRATGRSPRRAARTRSSAAGSSRRSAPRTATRAGPARHAKCSARRSSSSTGSAR